MRPRVDGVYKRPNDPSDSDIVATDAFLTFTANRVHSRYRYVKEASGAIERSTLHGCDTAVSTPVVWTEKGFRVLETVTAKSISPIFERTETAPEANGVRTAHYSTDWLGCSVSIVAGDYEVSDVSDAQSEGRPLSFSLRTPDGHVQRLTAGPDIDPQQLREAIDRHYWK